MAGRARRILWVIGGAALVLSVGVVLGSSSSAPAQQQTKPTATAAAPAPKPGYVGAETCKGCHEEAFNKFSHTRMGRIFLHQARNDKEATGCETCHGPGEAHASAGGGKGVGGMITFAKNDKTPVAKRNEICLSCHTKGARIFWQGSAHESRDVACTNCHKIMEDVSPKNQLAKETVIDTCDTCHTEKRGPFLWTHPPVQENCANCHDPHGSNHEAMLKQFKPRLCQTCHVETRHPTSPYGRDGSSRKFVMGRSCVDCHAHIHGSNHPSGFAFTR